MKTYSDATLASLKKEQLIQHIRGLERDVEQLEECNEYQYSLLAEKDEYNWHYITGLQADLPDIDREVIFAVRKDTGTIIYAFMGQEFNRLQETLDSFKIIGWKYFEEFRGYDNEL